MVTRPKDYYAKTAPTHLIVTGTRGHAHAPAMDSTKDDPKPYCYTKERKRGWTAKDLSTVPEGHFETCKKGCKEKLKELREYND